MVSTNYEDDSGSDSSGSDSEIATREQGSPADSAKSGSGRSASGSRSGSPHSPSRSRSATPQSSPDKSANGGNPTQVDAVRHDEDTRSQSPNLQIDDHASSRSRSRSRSGSRSGSSSRSRSGTPDRKSRSRSQSRSSVGSKSSRHSSASRSKSRSRSRSRSRSESGSRSRSGSPVQKKRRILSSGSESGNEKEVKKPEIDSSTKIKKSRIIDSESETEEVQTSQVDAQDIFGDADDISASSDDEKKTAGKRQSRSKSRSRSKSQTPASRSSSRRSRSGTPHSRSRSRSRSRSLSRSRSRTPARDLYNQETQKEDEVEPVPETRIDVEIPRIVTDIGRDIHFVKLPNFLSVDTRPFDPETYEDEIDEEETMDEEGRQRIKLKVSNTIRWREYMNNKGDMVKESNARFVRWSDGSMSLHLGNEIFDVYKQPLHGDHNHMFIRQGTGLQGQAVFRTKLTFRPHSTESFTHKKMTMSLADRSQKTSGIKILTQVGKDPTTDRLYQLKKEEEKLRQAMRSQHRPQPKKKKTDAHGVGGAGAYPNDDGSDDENAISLSAIKNKYKKGMSGAGGASTSGRKGSELKASAIYSSDDDDGSDFEQRRHKKIDKAKAVKALRDSDSESDAENVQADKKSDDEKSGSGSETANESDGGDGKSGTGSGDDDSHSD